MVKFLVLTGALLLPLAACGGSDDSSSERPGVVTTQAQAAPDEGGTVADSGSDATTPAPEADDGGGDAGGSGPSTAMVTIDGQTYNFSTEGAVVAQCKTDLFGIFSVQLPMVDGGGNINIVALREGTDPAVVEQVNAVGVSIGDEDWTADESSGLFDASDALQPGMSQVDAVEIDGSTVRGTATFVRQLSVFGGGELETMTGTFEATCGEERIS
jgi:hypothetical protein